VGRGGLVLLEDSALCWPRGSITLTPCFVSPAQYFPVQFHKGEHGFDNGDMDMKPFFRAVGPAFRRGLEVGPFETVHIYALMCHILGIRPEDNDGHLNATWHMLVAGAPAGGEFTPSNESNSCSSITGSLIHHGPLHHGRVTVRGPRDQGPPPQRELRAKGSQKDNNEAQRHTKRHKMTQKDLKESQNKYEETSNDLRETK